MRFFVEIRAGNAVFFGFIWRLVALSTSAGCKGWTWRRWSTSVFFVICLFLALCGLPVLLRLVEGGAKEETKQILQNLDTVLKARSYPFGWFCLLKTNRQKVSKTSRTKRKVVIQTNLIFWCVCVQMTQFNNIVCILLCVSFARSLAGSKQQHEAGPQLVFGWWCLMWSFNFLSSVKPSVVWNRLGQVTLCPGCICIQRLQDAIGSWQIENQRFSLLMVLSWQFLPCVSSRPQSWRLTNFRGAASHWSTFLGISRTWTRRVVLSTRSPTVLIRWDPAVQLEAYATFWPKDPPARVAVQVAALAGNASAAWPWRERRHTRQKQNRKKKNAWVLVEFLRNVPDFRTCALSEIYCRNTVVHRGDEGRPCMVLKFNEPKSHQWCKGRDSVQCCPQWQKSNHSQCASPSSWAKNLQGSLTTLLNLADSIRIKTACNMSCFFVKVPSLPDPSSKGKAYSFCDAKVSKIEPGQRLSTVLGHESGWNGLPEWSVSQASRQCIFEPRDLQWLEWYGMVILPSAVVFLRSICP